MRRGALLPGRRTWVTALIATCLVGAMLEPAVTLRRPTYDYVITLDVTQSMNTRDVALDGVRMSRIHYAKRLLRGLLPRLPCGSRVGWAIFTEYRVFLLFTPVEVCANYDALEETLNRIGNNMAWAGGSQIARGLFAGLKVAAEMPDRPDFVLITDGQEAPPINPEFRPAFDGTPGAVPGVILGVGGDTLSPIPMVGRDGRFLGYWAASQVPQTDAYSAGRATSEPHDLLYNQAGQPIRPVPPTGTEQLSSLKAEYLRSLAQETGLQYRRLSGPETLYSTLTQRAFARPARVRTEIGFVPAALALALLVWLYWPARAAKLEPEPRRARRGTDLPKLPL
jgi:mxaL protein